MAHTKGPASEMKAGHKSVRNRRDTASSADDPNAITLLVGGPRWQPGPSYQDRTYRSRSVSASAIRGHDSTVAQLDDAVRTIDHQRVVGGDHGGGETADRLAALDLTRIAEPGGIVRIRVSHVASGAETVCVRHRAERTADSGVAAYTGRATGALPPTNPYRGFPIGEAFTS
jgi:hypothetical protein